MGASERSEHMNKMFIPMNVGRILTKMFIPMNVERILTKMFILDECREDIDDDVYPGMNV
jgi:hypothetical protein